MEGLKLERLTVPVTDEQVDEAVERIASNNKSYKDAAKTKKAGDGDQLIIDFVGRVDGVEFEGGKAENTPLVIGSGQFIPGFEEQLTGVKTGDEKTITVTFPEDYPAENLKGKDAEFDVTVQQVKVHTLAAGHDFAVPQGMVEAEFEQIWAQLQQEAAQSDDAEAMLKEMDDEKDDYRKIAERRVRLGLLLSEIGQKNGVEVNANEMNMLIQQAAQQYRAEDRERFVQYVQSEPMAAAQLRAPLYEDKVVDFLFDKAEITDREVTREELEAAIEAEESTEEKPKKKAAAKKKAPAKKAADKDADDKPAAKKAPAKKAAAKKPAAKKADDKQANDKATAKKPAAKKPAAKKAAPKK